MTNLSEIHFKINNYITSNFTTFPSSYIETVHSTKRSEKSEYTPKNTREFVHFKEATNSNLNPWIDKSLVSSVSSTFDEQMFIHYSLKLYVFSSKTKRKQ